MSIMFYYLIQTALNLFTCFTTLLHSFGQYLKKKGKCYISKLLCSHFTCQGTEWYTSKLV